MKLLGFGAEKVPTRKTENPVADLVAPVLKKKFRGKALSPDEEVALRAYKEFGMQGNMRGFELVKKQLLSSLSFEESCELEAIRKFPGNKRLAELETKIILSTTIDGETGRVGGSGLTPAEKEEYDLTRDLYDREAMGEKP